MATTFTGCPTRYRTRHFFNNFTTNEDIADTTDAFLFISHTMNVLLFKFSCNIFIGVRIIKEMPRSGASGTLYTLKARPVVVHIWSVLSICYVFYALHAVKFQLFLSMLNFHTRLRSLEDEGFPRMKAATPVCSQESIILGRDVKGDTDDENLFEFPSDKKLRLANEEDEDIFAFPDEIRPKSLQAHNKKDEAVESSGLPRKRKSPSSESMSEPSSFIKRRASEKDVLQQQNMDFCKNEPMEHSVANHEGFLSVFNETKVRVFMVSPSQAVSECSELQCMFILNFNLPT